VDLGAPAHDDIGLGLAERELVEQGLRSGERLDPLDPLVANVVGCFEVLDSRRSYQTSVLLAIAAAARTCSTYR
jgi:hypothetical protein